MYEFIKITDAEIGYEKARKKCLELLKKWFEDDFEEPDKIEIKLLYKDDKTKFNVSAHSVLNVELDVLKEETQKSLNDFFDGIANITIIGNYGYKQNMNIEKLSLTKAEIEPTNDFIDKMIEILDENEKEPEKLKKEEVYELLNYKEKKDEDEKDGNNQSEEEKERN